MRRHRGLDWGHSVGAPGRHAMFGDRAFLWPRPAEDRESRMGHRFDRRFCILVRGRSFKVSARSRKTFQQLVTLPDSAIPLAEAALIMACEEYPQLDLSPYLDMLDHIAEVAQEKLSPAASPVETVETINTVLFET